MALFACKSVEDLKPQHGIVAVGIEGRKLYFKRETRSLSYDVLWLSENPDPCAPDDATKDDVFASQGPLTIFYRVVADKIIIYSASAIKEGTGGQLRRFVEHHLLQPREFSEIRDTYLQKGFTKLDVRVGSAARCG